MILLIDNYDSFSYNLFQMVGGINPDIRVVRNDAVTCQEIEAMRPSHIIISPGPGRPSEAGVCEDVIRTFAGKIPILGVCLGHQAICEAFGAAVTYAPKLMHGKQSVIRIETECPIFQGLAPNIKVGRYHSLAAARDERFPACLQIVAAAADETVMAVKHREYQVYGVQFHPESILTPDGLNMLCNFLKIKEKNNEIKENRAMITEAIKKLTANENLGYETAVTVMDEMMGGACTPAQVAAFLTALHIKGETIEEIAACAVSMRNHAAPFETAVPERIDIVGTGGDCAGTINISTIASFVAAAGGAKVAKHGNRAASSKCGTADCLEALGANLNAEASVNAALLEKNGFCFLFAQKYHTALRHVGGVRKEIGIPTVFNILGPLANPARANLQLLGVYDEKLLEPMAHVLHELGVKRAMVVHGRDGLDEITMCHKTLVCELDEGEFRSYEIDPEEYGFTLCTASDLTGGLPEENAQIVRDILSGSKGPKTDAVILNAAAALHITNRISLEEGIALAKRVLEDGSAYRVMEAYISGTNAEK